MNVKDLLEQVKNGTIEIEEAEKHLRKQPYEEMAMPSWIRTGRSAPAFRKLCIAVVSRMNFWHPFIRNCMMKMEKYSEHGQVSISMRL